MADERTAATASLRERFIDQAHYGNGTGCRCCDLVDDGLLEALLDERDRLRERIRFLLTTDPSEWEVHP